MKKIDFHIHTVSTVCDRDFEFCMDQLKSYVRESNLDAIAITNHNMFDKAQFDSIKSNLDIQVYPGIEIDVEGTHILLISNDTEVMDFKSRCDLIFEKIPDNTSSILVEELREVFTDLSKYILIPHYKKNPQVQKTTIEKLEGLITAGEVSGPKKFVHSIKDTNALVPVYFSDIRIDENLKKFPSRQTYIDVGEITIESLKIAFKDKNKVFLSREDGHKFFNVNNKLVLSTGLNVILGERSTGKSHTLDLINEEFSTEDSRVKYIKQFSLLQKDEDDEKNFSHNIKTSQSRITSNYLKEFENVLEDMKDVDTEKSNKLLEKFVSTLHKNATESHKQDSYANTKLFSESLYSLNNLDSLKKLISSTSTLIENIEFKKIIDKHISYDSLKLLLVDLILEFNNLKEMELKKTYVNDVVEDIQNYLKLHTAATPIEDIDLFAHMIQLKKIEKFNELCENIKGEKEFKRQEIEGFSKVAKRVPFLNATDLGTAVERRYSFAAAFEQYRVDGYSYLKQLRAIPSLEETNYYKLFVKIQYEVLNSKGFPVSGGERSEFRLLQEINNANEHDLLLIDEPESSFDNIFLYNKVNKLIKEISGQMPVVLVTHNSTVGASIQPNYLIYTCRDQENEEVVYKVFSGHPGDKVLVSKTGESTENHKVLLNCLEAGSEPYAERKNTYEVLKDK